MFDDRMVHVETVSAELTITQPREIALYGKVFEELSQSAVYGQGARELIMARLSELRAGTPGGSPAPSTGAVPGERQDTGE